MDEGCHRSFMVNGSIILSTTSTCCSLMLAIGYNHLAAKFVNV